MNEAKESSVLFSLRELMDLEHQRLDEESAIERRNAEAAAQAVLDARRQAGEELLARRLAEETSVRAEQARAREEAAHLAAVREAAVERVRREAEAAEELGVMRAQQAHERELRAIGEGAQKRRLAMIAGGLGAALVATLVFGGLYLHAATPVVAPSSATLESRETLKNLEAQLRAQREQVADLEHEARDAKEAREHAPPVVVAPPPVVPAHSEAPHRPTRTPAPTPPTCTNVFDPMCGALP